MTTNGDMTLFHYNSDSDTYSRSYFPRVFRGVTKQLVSEKGGVANADIARVRIPTKNDIIISKGDFIFYGKSEAEAPDISACYIVVGFRDNRIGVNPHWRIDAK